MSDNRVQRNWLVPEGIEQKKKWMQVEIQQKVSQIARLRQDIEDLKKGQILKLEATIEMIEKEKIKLEEDLKNIENAIDM